MYQTRFKALSVLLIVGASIPALSQVVPAVSGRANLPFRVGAGYSIFETDWPFGGGRLGGPSVWIDYDVPKMPASWSGLQLEVEGRDLNYTREVSNPDLRQYTVAGGVNYAWRYDPAFHPYVKFLVGVGNEEFGPTSVPGYHKDSRIFYAPAVGLDIRAYKRLWVRADYEYQFWPNFFEYRTQQPNGFTIGAFFDLSKFALIPERY